MSYELRTGMGQRQKHRLIHYPFSQTRCADGT